MQERALHPITNHFILIQQVEEGVRALGTVHRFLQDLDPGEKAQGLTESRKENASKEINTRGIDIG